MGYMDEPIPDNIKDLTVFINKDLYKRDIYQKYIIQFHEDWMKSNKEGIPNENGKYIWGSKVLVPAYYKVTDVFTDRLFTRVLKYFEDININLISDINEENLISLMNYPSIGYLRFINVLYILFIVEFRQAYNNLESIDKISKADEYKDKINHYEETEYVGGAAALIDEEVFDNELSDFINESDYEFTSINKTDNRLFDYNFPLGQEVEELYNFSDAIRQSIENGHNMVLKVRNSYNDLLNTLAKQEAENLDLSNEIKKVSTEKETETQNLRQALEDLEKNKNEELENVKKEYIDFINDKIGEINKLKDEIAANNQKYEEGIKTLNRSYNNLKEGKETEIKALQDELEHIKIERDEDRKVLDEFENMIKIMDKIKGIFRKE